jgi:hypothetical protein
MVVATAAALVALGSNREAAACGGFFKSGAARAPSLAHEQVLIVFDPKTDTEHFIRQVAFRDSNEPFGFVVPTPSRPEVAKVELTPFAALRQRFPFEPTPPGRGSGSGTGQGFGSGSGKLGGGVTVLDVSKVGSFTAFVLAADDAQALSKWLKEHQLTSTPESDEWLAHYVQMKFYYVAMRYDPPKPGPEPKSTAMIGDGPVGPAGGLAGIGPAAQPPASAVVAETIRISFKTPLPYYPYLEPKAQAGAVRSDRLLDLWMVSTEAMTPIALRSTQGPEWVAPMRAGHTSRAAQQEIRGALEEEIEKLLPIGELVVQTFQDQKWSRGGYGDILFTTTKRATLTAEDQDKLRPLLGMFDPELMPAAGQP